MGSNFHPKDNEMPVDGDNQETTTEVATGGDNDAAAINTGPDLVGTTAVDNNIISSNDGDQMQVDPTETAVSGESAAAVVQVQAQPQDQPGGAEVAAATTTNTEQFQELQQYVNVDHNEMITTAAAQATAAVTEHAQQQEQAQAEVAAQVQAQAHPHGLQHLEIPHAHDPTEAQVEDAAATVGDLTIPNVNVDTAVAVGGQPAMPALTSPSPQQHHLQVPHTGAAAATTYPHSLTALALSTPSKPSTKQERMDAIWMKHYRELQQYKSQHGHVRVPRKSGPLGEWVRTQRRYYKLWRRGESVPLTKERMELLDQLGFVWLPAEEKVGGGFRGGRPRKRKREEEDAIAAANAAAAAAVAAGQAPPGTYYHHHALAAQDVQVHAQGEAVKYEAMGGAGVGAVGGAVGDPSAAAGGDPAAGLSGGTVPESSTGAEGVEGAPTSTPIIPNYAAYHHPHHHDPYYYLSMSKRSDIANQIELLSNRQPLPHRQAEAKVKPSPGETVNVNDDSTSSVAAAAGTEGEYKTEKLNDAHSYYDDVVSVLKRSNEELRDAELALDRAKKKYDEAQALKDKADSLLSDASEGVLQAELEDGDSDWIHMYKCLVKYKEQNGNILFPRSGNNKNNGNGENSNAGAGENNSKEGNNTNANESTVSYGTMDLAIPKVEEEGQVEAAKISQAAVGVSAAVDVDAAVAAASVADAVAAANATTVQSPTEATEEVLPEAPVEVTEQSVAAEAAEKGAEEVAMQVDKPPLENEATVDGAVAGEVQNAETSDGNKEGEKKDEPEAMEVDPSVNDSAEGAVQEFVKVYEDMPKAGDAGTITIPSTMEDSKRSGVSTVTVTEAMLHDWVAKMRKFPKKQFKKWRRHALDKLGFVW